MPRNKIQKIPVQPTDHPLVVLCKERGNDACGIRDAAHEIFHAQTAGGKNWDREVIHKKLVKTLRPLGRAGLWLNELEARAVEQLVSKHYGYDCGPLDRWVHTSILEAIKFGLPYAEFDQSLSFAKTYLDKPYVQRAAQNIVSLVDSNQGARTPVHLRPL